MQGSAATFQGWAARAMHLHDPPPPPIFQHFPKASVPPQAGSGQGLALVMRCLKPLCPACCPGGRHVPRHQVKINIYWKIVISSDKRCKKKNSLYLELTCVSQASGSGGSGASAAQGGRREDNPGTAHRCWCGSGSLPRAGGWSLCRLLAAISCACAAVALWCRVSVCIHAAKDRGGYVRRGSTTRRPCCHSVRPGQAEIWVGDEPDEVQQGRA